MELNLKNKVIIVSGGAKGIGLGIAKVLAAENAIPFIIGRNIMTTSRQLQKLNHQGRKHFRL